MSKESISAGMQHQLQIYFGGTQNIKPQLPVSFEALEQRAREILKPETFDYIAGGAGSEITMHNNRVAFNHWQIIPRMMGDVSNRDIGIELFSKKLPTPLLPVSYTHLTLPT